MEWIQKNIACLYQHHPGTAKDLLEHLRNQRESGIKPTINIAQNESGYFLHDINDKRKIIDDAQSSKQKSAIITKMVNIEKCSYIVINSIGFGLYVSEIIKYINKVKFIIIEPDYDLLIEALNASDWTDVLASPNFLIFHGLTAKQDCLCFLEKYQIADLCGKMDGRDLREEEKNSQKPRTSNAGRSLKPTTERIGLGPAHEILQEVLANESAKANLDVDVSVRHPYEKRFFHDQSILRQTAGEPLPKRLLTFSEKWLEHDEWDELKTQGVHRSLWCYDDPYRNESIGDIESRFERVFCFDPVILERLRQELSVPAEYLPGATAFGDGLPESLEPTEENYAISFVGSTGLQRYNDQVMRWIRSPQSPYRSVAGHVQDCLGKGQPIDEDQLQTISLDLPFGIGFTKTALIQDLATFAARNDYLSAIAAMPLSIFGDRGWSEAGFVGRLAQRYQGKSLDYLQETPTVYANSKINLNMFNIQCVNSPTVRMLDVMACGGFLLTEHRPFIKDMFTIGEHLDVFRNREELAEKIRYYTQNDGLRRDIAENGKQIVLERHCYRHRLKRIFQP